MAIGFNLHSINGGLKEATPIQERAVRAEKLGFEGVFLGAISTRLHLHKHRQWRIAAQGPQL